MGLSLKRACGSVCVSSQSCAGLDPRIHLLRKKVLTKMDGLQDQARQ